MPRAGSGECVHSQDAQCEHSEQRRGSQGRDSTTDRSLPPQTAHFVIVGRSLAGWAGGYGRGAVEASPITSAATRRTIAAETPAVGLALNVER
jgi:hypothetical protein